MMTRSATAPLVWQHALTPTRGSLPARVFRPHGAHVTVAVDRCGGTRLTEAGLLRVVQSPRWGSVLQRGTFRNIGVIIMQNIEVHKEGATIKVGKNQMALVVDLTKRLGPSSSGKTTIVASTAGNAKIEGHDGLQFGLNVFAKAPAAEGEKGGSKNGK